MFFSTEVIPKNLKIIPIWINRDTDISENALFIRVSVK